MTAAIQTIWARLLVRTLADAGVGAVVVSPGSRSTPLVAALAAGAAGEVAVHTIVDERVAGFFALGLARASGAPVALVCTSGTAAAHWYPAVIEAAHAEIPLILVTADRPPELQGSGAPQTIDQTRLFGTAVRAAIELGVPDGSALALRALRRKIAQAVHAARWPRPGAVHINVPLRKPLEPAAPVTADDRAAAALAADLIAQPSPAPTPPTTLVADVDLDRLAAWMARSPRGLIVAGPGPLARRAARPALARLAAATGWVVCAEATSQLRGERGCGAFDLVMATPALRSGLAPQAILQLAAEPTAPGWPGFAAAHPTAGRAALAEHAWHDAEARADQVLIGDVADALDRLAARVEQIGATPDQAWRAAWVAADAAAWRALDGAITDHPSQGPACEHVAIRAAVGAVITAAARSGAVLALGNSLPVRLVDHVRFPDDGPAVISQRGASGIDGLVAGAAGAACAGAPVALILGDVSFAHDVGGLAAVRMIAAGATGAGAAPLAIVVIDNGGGRIFEGLPVAEPGSAVDDAAFARHWLTPPALDPVAVAAAFGVPARVVRDPDDLAAAVTTALSGPGPGATLIHAPVAASSARAVRRAALAALAAAADDVVAGLADTRSALPLPRVEGASR